LGTEPLQALSAGRGFDPHNGLVFLLSFNGFLANVEVAVYPCLFANLFGRDLTVNSRSKRAVLVSKNGIYSDDCMIIALMAQVPLALAFGFSVLAQLLVVCILPISVNPESAESLATRPGRATTPTTSECELPDLDVIPSKVGQAYRPLSSTTLVL
jgi:hypothetical protein